MTDQEQIDAISNGDNAVLEQIYKSFQVEFIQWCQSKYGFDHDSAKELFHESILAFFNNIKRGKLRSLSSSIKTYLFAIGKNKVKEKSRSKMIAVEQYLVDNIASENFDDKLGEIQNQRITLITKFLGQLGVSCKNILEAYYYFNMRMDDIASKFGYKNAATVKNLKYKCIVQLKQFISTGSNTNSTLK